jgi:uncharacterized protein (TIGR00369 family)
MTSESMPTQLDPNQLAAWLNDRVDHTLMGHMGIRAVEVGPERAVAHLQVDSGVKTRTGHVHTGAMLALADTTATYLAVAAIEGSYFDLARFPVAIGLTSQIVGNVKEGFIQAESTVVHGGRTFVVVETRVTSCDGRLLALVNTTHFVRGGSEQDNSQTGA